MPTPHIPSWVASKLSYSKTMPQKKNEQANKEGGGRSREKAGDPSFIQSDSMQTKCTIHIKHEKRKRDV